MKINSILSVLALGSILSGCGLLNLTKMADSNNENTDGGSQAQVEQTQLKFVSRSTYDCDGNVTGTDTVEYDCVENRMWVISARNIPIDRGEYTNLRNGSSGINDEPHSEGNYYKQSLYISECGHSQTLKMERGSNMIQYHYLTCGHKDQHAQCDKWDVQEEGIQEHYLKAQAVVDFTCKILPNCDHGQVTSYNGCTNWSPMTKPYVLWSDY